ncbi:hypothetical protein J7J95_03445 [bacterium]|nr:hypothetical protein [bacterium]
MFYERSNININEKLICYARRRLEKFLERSGSAISALRTLRREDERIVRLDPEEEELLRKEVINNSDGILDPENSGSLCQLENGGIMRLQHQGEGINFKKSSQKDVEAIRGFYFSLELDGFPYECFIFDGGGSRKYYDDLPEEGKKKFFEDFANRRRSSEIPLDPSSSGELYFVAFINDTPKGLKIDRFGLGSSLGNQ